MTDDKEAIHRVIASYNFATDSGDIDTFVSLFTEDCLWTGVFGECRGKDALRAFISQGGEGAKALRHLVTNEIIDVVGDTATARSYITVLDVKAAGTTVMFAGIYDDQLVRVGGRWLFRVRKILAGPSDLPARAGK